MNKVITSTISLLFCFIWSGVNAQLLLPNFEPPVSLKGLNTESEEIAPVPFSNGEKLYFVRYSPEGKSKDRKAGQEIWTAEREGDSWSEPKNIFEEANDLGNNGVIGSSADGSKIYVFNSIQSRRKLARGIAYVEKQDDGTWSDLKKLKIDGFEIGEGYYSFYMNQAEDVLLISMAPNRKTINEDIFVSVKDEEGNWSEVTTLGPKINTSGIEISPFITADKNAIYFASNGHGGLGGVDVFVSYRLGEGWSDWTPPQNLGAPINSAAFDAYFMIGNNKEVFFVSNRDSTMGDVYATKIVEKKSVQLSSDEVNGQFLYKNLPAENIKLLVYDQYGNVVDTVITDESGKFSYRKLKVEETYFVRIAEEDASDYVGAVFYELAANGSKTKRHILTESGVFVEGDQLLNGENVIGSFKYENLPLENAYVLVYDEEGVVVDTIITDSKGNFIYKKLNAEENYTFKPLDVLDEDGLVLDFENPELDVNGSFNYKNLPLENSALLVLDENGSVIDTIYTDAQGKFNYKKLRINDEISFKPVTLLEDDEAYDYIIEAVNRDDIKGNMNFNNLPLKNIPLLVKNEKGEVVDTVYTDMNGDFNYKKLKTDENYTFEIIQQNNDLSLLDFVNEQQEKEEVNGSFNYKNLPMQNEALVVLDQNGFPVDTIYTDDNGNFSYNKLKGDTEFTIALLNNDNIDADLISIDFGQVKEVKAVKKEEGNKKITEQPLEYVIYFDFNETVLTKDDFLTLNKVIGAKEILLFGHTDSIGTEDQNKVVAKGRVEAAAAYLVQKGISPSSIKKEVIGESEPAVRNSSEEGRSKNRRVVIVVK